MAATLDQLGKGQSARIVAVTGDGAVTQRLMALGLLPGQTVSVVGVAPMGDPITIQSTSGRLSLRKAEAAAVQVEAAPHWKTRDDGVIVRDRPTDPPS